MKEFSKSSHLFVGNSELIESLYSQYQQHPESVTAEWQRYFKDFNDDQLPRHQPDRNNGKSFRANARTQAPNQPVQSQYDQQIKKQVSVLQLINAHRFRGHREADLEPLKHYQRPVVDELNYAYHGLTEADLDTQFNTGSLVGPEKASLRNILAHVKQTYCGSIGAEYMHINATAEKRWIQQQLESCSSQPKFDKAMQCNILERVIAANVLEEYLHTRYVGQKRFSLEGGESLIPMLDHLIENAGENKVREVIVGMAHRGRLNVLINILGKDPADLFEEFEGIHNQPSSSGDVKYHLGYSSNISTEAGPVHLSLAFNPSHLEIISPVVEGSVRSRQERRSDTERKQVLPIIIHGDAAFAGQGVVMETFNLSQTRGYKTGGTIHIIINNQIGFTTSDPLDSRSTLYCTDVAKMIQAPIFHVNGDDPEAVVFLTKLAIDYRMEFNKDIVIDMICYRKHGHSEADEPAATQPVMYKRIKRHPGVRNKYAAKLIEDDVITRVNVEQMEIDYIKSLESNKTVSAPKINQFQSKYFINYDEFRDSHWNSAADTSIDDHTIKHIANVVTTVPEGFELHSAVEKILDSRKKMANAEMPFDWGFAEMMAYGSLLQQGYSVRISGQDSSRGTFFHRHSVFHNQANGDTHVPLQHIEDNQPSFIVIDSTLSEEAVLGYEYGYSSSAPETLVIWEAQFGDFANGAQVVFDQFISSCEAKWGRFCGLTVLLPHGYDGQGPEHSSARLERYLQLCAQDNMQVCVPSTAAQMFHMLRRQMIRPYRKPLIIMSPKSLLRNKLSCSPLSDLTEGSFLTVIDEQDDHDPNLITRLLFCTGKVYYDLLRARRENNLDKIAIIRLEQLYPFPRDAVQSVIKRYPNMKEVVWVQEEPKNQGSWYYMQSRRTMIGCIGDHHQFGYAGRPYSASPAVGTMAMHLEQQRQLIADALKLDKLEITHKKSILLA